jgi:hypothetical protein
MERNVNNQDAQRLIALTETVLQECRALQYPSAILNGLADRPKPGQKALARKAFTELLANLHTLRLEIERAKPLQIVASNG